MIQIIGKNGSGKTFIANELSKRGYDKVVGYTTRNMRKNEINKVDYNFIDKNEFENMINNNQFIDYKIRNGNYYGISKKGITNNSIIISGDSDIISASTGLSVYKIYLDADIKNRYERMIKRNKNDNLFYRIHLENFSFLNDFEALFIDNNCNNPSIVDYIENVINYGIISQDKLIDNRLFILKKVNEYKPNNYKKFDIILNILEYEEYILRSLSLMSCNDKKIVYYKLMKEHLDMLRFQYEEDSNKIIVHVNKKIYKLKYEER